MLASAAGAAMADFVSTAGSGIIATGATVAVGLAYRAVRPYFKATVNCHFCNTDCKVKYHERNSWCCPYCGQYNGFTVDGDYNQRDHLFTSTPVHMFTQPKKQSKEQANNGLCKKCNLNQELKVSQLASFTSEDKDFDEYREHLERVYRLCAVCEAVLADRLGEQNAIIAPALLEHKLETSRLANSSQYHHSRGQSTLRNILCHLQIVVAILYFVTLLIPNLSAQYLQLLPVSFQVLLENCIIMSLKYDVEIVIFLTGLLALLGVILSIGNPILILNIAPFIMENIGLSKKWSLVASTILLTLVPLYSMLFRRPRSNVYQRSVAAFLPDSLSSKLIALDNTDDLDETLTSRDSITTKSSSEGKQSNGKNDDCSPLNTIGLFTKLTGFVNAPTVKSGGKDSNPRRVHSPLIWSGDQGTLNHEFVVQSGRNCDIASLSLGDEGEERSPLGSVVGGFGRALGSISPSVFSQRVYSPTPNPDGIRFAPSRPILRPAQLTSWVAGGYWAPPDTKLPPGGESHSRSSSQSSGFVSTGLISGSPSLENLSNFLQTNHVSLPTSPRNSIFGDYDRNSVLSAPIMKRDNSKNHNFVTQRRHTTDEQLSESSIGRESQIELHKLLKPAAQSSPNCSSTASKTALNSPLNDGENNNITKSLNEKLSFTVTVTPVGFILAASLTINFALMYFYLVK